MRVTKVYEDGRLVSCKKTGESTSTQVDSRCLSALRKEVTYEMNSFILNVGVLQKELARATRLLGARTFERDSVKKAHRKRLQQVYTLKSTIEELKLEALIVKEDMDSLNPKSFINVQFVGNEEQPLSGRAYEITLPDGSELKGELDSDGRAKHEGVPSGKCNFRLLPEVAASNNLKAIQSDYTFGVRAKAIKKG